MHSGWIVTTSFEIRKFLSAGERRVERPCHFGSFRFEQRTIESQAMQTNFLTLFVLF